MRKNYPSCRAVILLVCTLGYLTAAYTAAQTDPNLQNAIAAMDTAAENFRSAQADFVWEQYFKVVNENDSQKGTVYYRKSGKDVQMMADITDPAPKSVLFSEGKVQVYEPKLKRVTAYEAGKNREAVESFLVLGFGSGRDMLKSFDVKYLTTEKVGDVNAYKLELVPKSERVRNIFAKIWLWIDPAHGISVQQQFFEPSGDYRLAKYSDLKLNQKIADAAFKLKTSSDTKVMSGPKG
jgi:outer membrane lipoprotein-sorting protein